jgi:hypothetical protein
VTEAILDTLLPVLIEASEALHAGAEAVPELAYQQVAAASLCATCLLNAPPGFIEFLLCAPWSDMELLHATHDYKDALDAVHVSPEGRHTIVNTPVPDHLLEPLLTFIYRDEFELSLPPLLLRSHDSSGSPVGSWCSDADAAGNLWPPVTTEVAEAALHRATPLHCAALRGNPAQTDHLLHCRADATAPNAAGMLPLDLVPYCGDYSSAQERCCRCMHARDAAVWECRSRATRELLMQRMLVSPRGGLRGWGGRALKVWACWLELGGGCKALWRPQIEAHVVATREAKSRAARAAALARADAIRGSAAAAQDSLITAEHQLGALLASAALAMRATDADEDRARLASMDEGMCPHSVATAASGGVRTFLAVARGGGAEYNAAVEGAQAAHAHSLAAVTGMLELASEGYLMRPQQVHAVRHHQRDSIKGEALRIVANSCKHACHVAAGIRKQHLTLRRQADLRYGRDPGRDASAVVCVRAAIPSHVAQYAPLPTTPQAALLMPISEQALVVVTWASAAALKARLCACAGCAAAAMHTAAACHTLAAQLFAAAADAPVDTSDTPEGRAAAARRASEWEATGRALASVLERQIELFCALMTDASATAERIDLAAACLRELDALGFAGVTGLASHITRGGMGRVRTERDQIAELPLRIAVFSGARDRPRTLST